MIVVDGATHSQKDGVESTRLQGLQKGPSVKIAAASPLIIHGGKNKLLVMV